MPRILIIDDNDELRGMLKLFLADAGFQVEEASNGVEGLKLAQKNRPDLVIVDILMPEKGGLETIQDMHRDAPDLKVIAISGGFKHETDSQSPFAEMFDVQRTLSKPFAPSELLKAVREVLGSGTR